MKKEEDCYDPFSMWMNSNLEKYSLILHFIGEFAKEEAGREGELLGSGGRGKKKEGDGG